ncbi:Alginate biosynthesis protein AlgA [bioreactor metagenome]|uniref:Alginate biosynthesis protein AlgA n=1 Tax=bioreactor metagenome TaxID=1076179 RepID=A0A644WJB9_9ZZZZ
MTGKTYCVIMAGGLGTRFWPMSRTLKPKQFIDVLGMGKTLIQLTFDRLLKICPAEQILVVTNETYVDLVKQQLPAIDPRNILSEPSRRNTAPCIAYAAHRIHSCDPDAAMIVCPSDHIIFDEDAFIDHLKSARAAAQNNNWLMTLGIMPTRPDTGYGYIQFLDGSKLEGDSRIKKVKTFTEKPQLELAKEFIKSGDFLWNSGIFVWTVASIIGALGKHVPEMNTLFAKGEKIYRSVDEADFIFQTYMLCKNISIDYAVMEKADNVYVVASDFGWSDLGTWGSLYENRQRDQNGNAIVGKNVMIYDSRNCLVHMPQDKMVLLQGLNDYIVVESDNILMVVRKEDEQNIRQYVNDVMIEKGEQFT